MYIFLIFYSFSIEGHKFISMYILLCVLPSLNKGFTYYLLTYLLEFFHWMFSLSVTGARAGSGSGGRGS